MTADTDHQEQALHTDFAAYYPGFHADDWPVDALAEYVDQIWQSHAGVEDRTRVLDVGCGTGRLLAKLDEYGWDVYGLDSSAAMVTLATERVGGGRVFQQRMQDATRLPSVTLATAFNNTIAYNTRVEELRATAATIADHVSRGGVVVFDLFTTPDVDVDRFTEQSVQFSRSGRGVAVRIGRLTPHPDDGVVVGEYVIVASEDGAQRYTRETHTFGYFPVDTVVDVFSDAGFDVTVYTAFTTDVFDGDGIPIIVGVAE